MFILEFSACVLIVGDVQTIVFQVQSASGVNTRTSEKPVTKVIHSSVPADLQSPQHSLPKAAMNSHGDSNGNSYDKGLLRTERKSLGSTYVLGQADSGSSDPVQLDISCNLSRESSSVRGISKQVATDDGITGFSPEKTIDFKSVDGVGINDDSEESDSGRTWILESARTRDSIPVVDAELDERDREAKIAALSKMLKQTLTVNASRPHTAVVNGRVQVWCMTFSIFSFCFWYFSLFHED